MTTPRCPFCNAQGLDLLKIEQTALFQVVCCGQCGAIHGILPLAATPVEIPNNRPQSAQLPKETPGQDQTKNSALMPVETALDEHPRPIPEQSPSAKAQALEPKPAVKKPLTKDQIGLMALGKGFYSMAFDAPLCPKCNIEMIEEKVPEGHKEAGQSFWKCPNFQTCKQWLLIKN